MVGRMLKTMEVSTKLMPRVPRSMARAKPPVWRERWKRRSSESRWRKVLQATWRMDDCATLENTTFLSSVKPAAPTRAAPSAQPS
jgi:hypothetical protein